MGRRPRSHRPRARRRRRRARPLERAPRGGGRRPRCPPPAAHLDSRAVVEHGQKSVVTLRSRSTPRSTRASSRPGAVDDVAGAVAKIVSFRRGPGAGRPRCRRAGCPRRHRRPGDVPRGRRRGCRRRVRRSGRPHPGRLAPPRRRRRRSSPRRPCRRRGRRRRSAGRRRPRAWRRRSPAVSGAPLSVSSTVPSTRRRDTSFTSRAPPRRPLRSTRTSRYGCSPRRSGPRRTGPRSPSRQRRGHRQREADQPEREEEPHARRLATPTAARRI